jgi:hypothetical protein
MRAPRAARAPAAPGAPRCAAPGAPGARRTSDTSSTSGTDSLPGAGLSAGAVTPGLASLRFSNALLHAPGSVEKGEGPALSGGSRALRLASAGRAGAGAAPRAASPRPLAAAAAVRHGAAAGLTSERMPLRRRCTWSVAARDPKSLA